ncbi:MAG: hypothetical protein LBS46_01600 [Dysgonamonadaceae bacterium]|jgi:hypothetical protein|nr:hypothetical protein [Dysgonamonadaceae bacterium]
MEKRGNFSGSCNFLPDRTSVVGAGRVKGLPAKIRQKSQQTITKIVISLIVYALSNYVLIPIQST